MVNEDKALLDVIDDYIFILNTMGTIIYANKAAIEQFGYTMEELRNMSVLMLYPPQDRPIVIDVIQIMLKGKCSIWSRYMHLKNGQSIPVTARVVKGKLENQDVFYIISTNLTNMEQKAEESVNQRAIDEDLWPERSLFIGGPTIVFLWQNEEGWPVEYVSPNVHKILGYEAADFLSGQISFASIVHPDDLEQTIADVLLHTERQTSFFEQVYHIITAKGETRWFHDFTVVKRNSAGEVTHFHGYLNDITEHKVFEEKMAQLDRLNTIGEVAAGIGHEVRNPMTTVRGYLQLFQKKSELAKYHQHLSLMIDELDRANSIITEFLMLSKNKAVQKKQGNLNQVIEAFFPILQAEVFQKGHQLKLATEAIPDSFFDEKEIRQLILNMVRNGLEAMECKGQITIKTYFENRRIIMAIQDTGSGIAQDIMAKLGTPFVTTKEYGTGLGLSICYRIAANHQAQIEVITSSEGTTFKIIFPHHSREVLC